MTLSKKIEILRSKMELFDVFMAGDEVDQALTDVEKAISTIQRPTARDIVIGQIDLQEKMQALGLNVVSCGNCGTVMIHALGEGETDLECFCGTQSLSDCSDLYYRGIEDNAEFNY